MPACCNAQVIEPIQSRCAILRFVRLGDTEILSRLQWVCRQEKVCKCAKFTSHFYFSPAFFVSSNAAAASVCQHLLLALLCQPAVCDAHLRTMVAAGRQTEVGAEYTTCRAT